MLADNDDYSLPGDLGFRFRDSNFGGEFKILGFWMFWAQVFEA